MTPSELVKHTREEVDEMLNTAHFCGHSINQKYLGKVFKFYAEKMAALADALEQQARELAACEGALRNSGNMVRDLNDLAKQCENDLAAARRETEEMRDRTIRDIARIVLDYTRGSSPGGQWTAERMLEAI